jgi:hypothetical protein
MNSLPEDDSQRGSFPMFDGLLAYFPNALAAVSEISKHGSEKHNKGQPMHWARGKSTDHLNKIIRHAIDAGGKDSEGYRHSAYLAWRALANLQEEIEREGEAPMSRGSKLAKADEGYQYKTETTPTSFRPIEGKPWWCHYAFILLGQERWYDMSGRELTRMQAQDYATRNGVFTVYERVPDMDSDLSEYK